MIKSEDSVQIFATMENAESSSRFLIQERTIIGKMRMAIQTRRLRLMLNAKPKIYVCTYHNNHSNKILIIGVSPSPPQTKL